MGDKTEKPTPKRLRDARRDGKVARSADFDAALSCLAVFAVTYGLAVLGWGAAVSAIREFITVRTRNPSLADAQQVMDMMVIVVLAFAGLLCTIAALVSGLSGTLQTQGVFSAKPMSPDPSKLNPIAGLKKIFSIRTVATAVTVAVKLGVVWAVADHVVDDIRLFLGSYLLLSGPTMMAALAKPIATLTWGILIFSVGLAAADLIVQRMIYMKEMKQEKHEVKQDIKSMEGDFLTKGRRKSIGWSNIFEGPESSVKRSNVIVTNPTHLCIGLRYDPDGDAPVPVVTILAADRAAARVRHFASLHGVPTVEWVWLARRLYSDASLGEPVPDALLSQVADVLAWLQTHGVNGDAVWKAPEPDQAP
jgi:type III secretion protein U